MQTDDDRDLQLSDRAKDFLGRLAVPVFVALLTGGFGAWLGVDRAMTSFEERLGSIESDVQRIDQEPTATPDDVSAAKREVQKSTKAYTDRKISELLVKITRVEGGVNTIQSDVTELKTDQRDIAANIRSIERSLRRSRDE